MFINFVERSELEKRGEECFNTDRTHALYSLQFASRISLLVIGMQDAKSHCAATTVSGKHDEPTESHTTSRGLSARLAGHRRARSPFGSWGPDPKT